MKSLLGWEPAIDMGWVRPWNLLARQAGALLASAAARKTAVAVVGSSVLVVGLALVVLPGPAFVVIPVGLTILAREFVWPRRILATFRPLVVHLRSGSRRMLAALRSWWRSTAES